MPDDELSLAANLKNHGWAIALVAGLERSPHFLAAVLFKSDYQGIAAREANDLVAFQQGVSGKPPDRHGCVVLCPQILRPDQHARGRVQAEKIAHGAERVNLAGADHGGSPWPGGVLDFIGAIIFAIPQHLARRRIEAKHPFLAGQRRLAKTAGWQFFPVVRNEISDIHAAFRNGWSSVTGSDGRAPASHKPVLRKPLQDAIFSPDTISLRPEPLRPVVSLG